MKEGNCLHTLKEKIEWLLQGGYLIDKGDDKLYAYGLDLETNVFYAVAHYRVGSANPNRYLEKQTLPLIYIAERMEILLED